MNNVKLKNIIMKYVLEGSITQEAAQRLYEDISGDKKKLNGHESITHMTKYDFWNCKEY